MITKTFSGHKVEILAVLGPGEEANGHAIIGVLCDGEERSVETWSRYGQYRGDGQRSTLDLIAIPAAQVLTMEAV